MTLKEVKELGKIDDLNFNDLSESLKNIEKMNIPKCVNINSDILKNTMPVNIKELIKIEKTLNQIRVKYSKLIKSGN